MNKLYLLATPNTKLTNANVINIILDTYVRTHIGGFMNS